MDKYVCPCGYEYDPAAGDPDNGVAPGTPWDQVPDSWVCPICGMGKDVFEKASLRQKGRHMNVPPFTYAFKYSSSASSSACRSSSATLRTLCASQGSRAAMSSSALIASSARPARIAYIF